MHSVNMYSDEVKELRFNNSNTAILELFDGENFIRCLDGVTIGIVRFKDGTFELEYNFVPENDTVRVCWFSSSS